MIAGDDRAVAADDHPAAGRRRSSTSTDTCCSPAAVEPHAHLDKAFLAERIVNPTGDLMGAIEAMEANRHLLDVRRHHRAGRTGGAADGHQRVQRRPHPRRRHAGERAAQHRGACSRSRARRRRDRRRDRRAVRLAGDGRRGSRPTGRCSARRLDAGADLVGGCPHLEGDGERRAATDVFLELATELGVGVDLHTDETLDPSGGRARRARHGRARRVRPPGHRQPLREPRSTPRSTSSGRSPSSSPRPASTSSRSPTRTCSCRAAARAPMPRGLTAVAALRAAGVNVAAGADNLQDPFNPVGRACPFETAGLMIMAAHHLPAEAWRAVSTDVGTHSARTAAGRGRRRGAGGPDGGPGQHRPRGDRLRSRRAGCVWQVAASASAKPRVNTSASEPLADARRRMAPSWS